MLRITKGTNILDSDTIWSVVSKNQNFNKKQKKKKKLPRKTWTASAYQALFFWEHTDSCPIQQWVMIKSTKTVHVLQEEFAWPKLSFRTKLELMFDPDDWAWTGSDLAAAASTCGTCFPIVPTRHPSTLNLISGDGNRSSKEAKDARSFCPVWQTWTECLSRDKLISRSVLKKYSRTQSNLLLPLMQVCVNRQCSTFAFLQWGPFRSLLVAVRRTLEVGMARDYMGKPRFQLLWRTKHFLVFFHHELHGFISHVFLPAMHFWNSSIRFVSHE